MKVTAEAIEGFVKTLLLKSFDDAKEIPDCHREWWQACCSDHKFVAIAAPRGFAKSTAITHSYVLAKLVFRESSFIILVSDTEAQSILFLNDIKKELLENEDLQRLFGFSGLIKETEHDIIIGFSDGHEARIIAKGSGQKVRGLKWGNKRPDLIVCDDMENDELVMNKERRDKLKKWFTGSLMPIRSDKGIIRIVGTILHADSLLNSFMPNEYDKTVITEELKIRDSRPRGWYSLLYRAHNRDFTKLLWESKKPADELKRIRATYEQQHQLDVYSQEYLNKPIDESNTHFRRSDFLSMGADDFEKPLTYYITMDLAVTRLTSADNSVLMVSGMDSDGYIQVRHVIRERLDSLQIVDLMFELVRAYDPLMVVTEKGTIVNSIMPTIEKKMQEENLYFRIELIASTTDKIQRSQAIRLRSRAGKVKVDKSQDWWPTLEDEIMAFPRGIADDQVDALSLIGLAINKFSEASTPQEQEDEAYEEEREQGGFHDDGRCQLTGY